MGEIHVSLVETELYFDSKMLYSSVLSLNAHDLYWYSVSSE